MGNQRDALYARQLRGQPLAPRPQLDPFKSGYRGGFRSAINAVRKVLAPEHLRVLDTFQNVAIEHWLHFPDRTQPPPRSPQLEPLP